MIPFLPYQHTTASQACGDLPVKSATSVKVRSKERARKTVFAASRGPSLWQSEPGGAITVAQHLRSGQNLENGTSAPNRFHVGPRRTDRMHSTTVMRSLFKSDQFCNQPASQLSSGCRARGRSIPAGRWDRPRAGGSTRPASCPSGRI